METTTHRPFIRTEEERCRLCYTCVRECPAKAIRVADGQAEIVPERCIACGNCVRVCSQAAKQTVSSIPEVEALLAGPHPVAAMLAPSFPAEWAGTDYRALVAMIRRLGFDQVHEVGFGADLVAQAYQQLLAREDRGRYIATSCPAIVAYIERYHPKLVRHLAPIVSPMVAMARALHQHYGADLRIVFVGPCIAKKYESASVHLPGEVDAALTFAELRDLFTARGVESETAGKSDFDPPHAGPGAIFAVSRGLLQAARIEEDLMSGEVVAADGRSDFVEAIREFDAGDLDARLLETLACKGCIMGAGMTADAPLFSRRRQVARHVRSRLRDRGSEQWEADMAAYAELDLDRTYAESDQRIPLPSKAELEAILARMGKHDPKDELNCGACGYDTCREHAIAVYKGLAESEMCLPYSIDELKRTVKELNDSHHQLAQSHHDLEETQAALMHSEKLASMGQLAAGIAHELNNPLGVVLMYAHLLQEDEAAPPDLRADLQLIAEEADRCKKIVAGLLHFARQNKVVRQPVDLAALVEKALKATTVPDSVAVRVDRAALGDPVAEIDGDQVLQILINFLSNACSAMEETGGTLTVTLSGDAERVRLCVADTGCGIAEEHRGRIFDPFFTTKQIGVGTGLGLAVTYGIVKMHNGDIQVESNADPARGPTGAAFTVTLPRKGGAKPS